jgi:hypothetical protein
MQRLNKKGSVMRFKLMGVCAVVCVFLSSPVFCYKPPYGSPPSCTTHMDVYNHTNQQWPLDVEYADQGGTKRYERASSFSHDPDTQVIDGFGGHYTFELPSYSYYHHDSEVTIRGFWYCGNYSAASSLSAIMKGGPSEYSNESFSQINTKDDEDKTITTDIIFYEHHYWYSELGSFFKCYKSWHSANYSRSLPLSILFKYSHVPTEQSYVGFSLWMERESANDTKCADTSEYVVDILPPAQRLLSVRVSFANQAAFEKFAPMAKQSVADIDPSLIAKLGVIENSYHGDEAKEMDAMKQLQSVVVDPEQDDTLLFQFAMVCDRADPSCVMSCSKSGCEA